MEWFISKFRLRFRVRQETPEEGRRTQRRKRCEINNRDDDNGLNTLNEKNKQTNKKHAASFKNLE